jgi:hypothetical protein
VIQDASADLWEGAPCRYCCTFITAAILSVIPRVVEWIFTANIQNCRFCKPSSLWSCGVFHRHWRIFIAFLETYSSRIVGDKRLVSVNLGKYLITVDILERVTRISLPNVHKSRGRCVYRFEHHIGWASKVRVILMWALCVRDVSLILITIQPISSL